MTIVRARVLLDIVVTSEWGYETTMAQVTRQAADEASNTLRLALSPAGSTGLNEESVDRCRARVRMVPGSMRISMHLGDIVPATSPTQRGPGLLSTDREDP